MIVPFQLTRTAVSAVALATLVSVACGVTPSPTSPLANAGSTDATSVNASAAHRPQQLQCSGGEGQILIDGTEATFTNLNCNGAWTVNGEPVTVRGVCSLKGFVGDDLGDDNFRGNGPVFNFSLNFEEIMFVGDDLGDPCGSPTNGGNGSGSFTARADAPILKIGGKDEVIGYQFSRARGLLIPAVQ